MNAIGTPSEAEAQSLLDFTRDLDIRLLDAVVKTVMMPPSQRQQEYCNGVLMTFKEHPEAWTRVDAVLEFSQSQQTKFFGLSVLEHTIKTRWKMLPPDQREAIKEYIVGLVIKMSASDEALNAERAFVAKLNLILVEILKQEWPHNWPNFISEIVAASKSNETLCQNNLVILKLLSEEVFDFSSGQMTKVKARRLKDTMNEQFGEVFQLCTFVMEHSQKAPLILATLQTLHRFLTWIPLGYMFETTLIDTLIFQFFPVPMFRVVTLQCLTEIASIKLEADQYQEQLLRLFSNTMTQLTQMLPPGTNMNVAYRTGSADEQALIQALSLFLTGFLKEHGKLLEARPDIHPVLISALDLLVMISDVDETEIFKICLEYWNGLAESLYQEDPVMVSTTGYSPFAFGAHNGSNAGSGRRQLYAAVLSKVRLLMITHMVKPEEVLIVETESGEVVREFMPQHTDTLNQYRTMRETLVYLTHLDCTDTRNIMTEKLHKQVDKSEYSWKNLNTLCWAIGSISGAMSEEDEKQFLVTIIKYLLGMCEIVRGKDNKAVIASNIMYIVGQYPRFLRAHWKFLKTVVYKLFEFMHELHEGVQDMACDTFIKIAQKCRRYFVILQVGESMPFVDEIIQTMSTIICDLQPHQVHTFYEAVGYMIAAAPDRLQRERLIQNCMALPNSAWDDIINRTAQDVNTLQNPEMIKHLTNILKTNVAACSSIGHPFVIQLSKLYLDLLNLYKCISEMISNSIARNGEQVTKTQLIRSQRAVKKETLKLIESWISKSEDPQLVIENFVPPLFEAVLGDYVRNIPQARDPEVLSCMSALVRKVQSNITDQVPVIFEAVFAVTLDMINKDLAEYPEHRSQFFDLLDAINDHCFTAFFLIPAAHFKLVIDSIVWAMKHTMRNVNETGLTILHNMLVNVNGHQAAQDFYKAFFVTILEHIFAVVSDPAHQSGFKQICDILALMVALVENGDIKVPLGDDAALTNQLFVRQYLASLLQSAFPNLQPDQVQITVEKLFLEYKDLPAFRQTLQDFLVQIKVFGEQDVYIAEERLELEKEKESRQKQLAAIPGMVNPHAVQDTMAD